MRVRNQHGSAQTGMIVAVLMTVLFVFALIFGLLMLVGKSDLQKNIDAKVAEGVAAEAKVIEAKKDAELVEKEKSPVKTYNGPSTFGSVSFDYPKTYSAYVAESTSAGGTLLDGFMMPNVVPKDDKSVSYALRFQLVASAYDTQVKTFDAGIKAGKVTSKAFRAAKVSDVLGVRIDGEIINGKQGSMIIVPVRDKTLKVWTESKEGIADFNTYVLPNLSFAP